MISKQFMVKAGGAYDFVIKVATSIVFSVSKMVLHLACIFPNWKRCYLTRGAHKFVCKVAIGMEPCVYPKRK